MQRPPTTASHPSPQVLDDGQPRAGLWHAKPVPPSGYAQPYKSHVAGQQSFASMLPSTLAAGGQSKGTSVHFARSAGVQMPSGAPAPTSR